MLRCSQTDHLRLAFGRAQKETKNVKSMTENEAMKRESSKWPQQKTKWLGLKDTSCLKDKYEQPELAYKNKKVVDEIKKNKIEQSVAEKKYI